MAEIKFLDEKFKEHEESKDFRDSEYFNERKTQIYEQEILRRIALNERKQILERLRYGKAKKQK